MLFSIAYVYYISYCFDIQLTHIRFFVLDFPVFAIIGPLIMLLVVVGALACAGYLRSKNAQLPAATGRAVYTPGQTPQVNVQNSYHPGRNRCGGLILHVGDRSSVKSVKQAVTASLPNARQQV